MIPQTKIDQAAGDYRDGLLKEKNRTTGQFVGIPPTHKEIEAMVIGYADGMTAGVRFAESEMGQIAQEFAEWCVINGWQRSLTRPDFVWFKPGSMIFGTSAEGSNSSDLYAKFDQERSAK